MSSFSTDCQGTSIQPASSRTALIYSIALEIQHRAKCLTAQTEIVKRAKRVADIEVELQQQKERANAKEQAKRHAMAEIMAVCMSAGLEPTDENLAQCKLKDFEKLKAPQL